MGEGGWLIKRMRWGVELAGGGEDVGVACWEFCERVAGPMGCGGATGVGHWKQPT